MRMIKYGHDTTYAAQEYACALLRLLCCHEPLLPCRRLHMSLQAMHVQAAM